MLRSRFAPLLALALCIACGRPGASDSDTSSENKVKNHRYPSQPNLDLTPGSVCKRASAYRYPEHIKYCERSVSTGLKRNIIVTYDNRLGFTVGRMPRQQFKIDHFIPLCMGGSNETSNLWPQHQSLYMHTDSLEFELCTAMQEGRLLQADAIAAIKAAKLDIKSIDAIRQKLF